MGDRTSIVPNDHGPLVLPCHPLFNRLIRFAHHSQQIAVRDIVTGFKATHLQLLADVLALRGRLESCLAEDILLALRSEEEIYIAVLAGGGYEYVVAMLAVLAIGAAAVPMSRSKDPPDIELC